MSMYRYTLSDALPVIKSLHSSVCSWGDFSCIHAQSPTMLPGVWFVSTLIEHPKLHTSSVHFTLRLGVCLLAVFESSMKSSNYWLNNTTSHSVTQSWIWLGASVAVLSWHSTNSTAYFMLAMCFFNACIKVIPSSVTDWRAFLEWLVIVAHAGWDVSFPCFVVLLRTTCWRRLTQQLATPSRGLGPLSSFWTHAVHPAASASTHLPMLQTLVVRSLFESGSFQSSVCCQEIYLHTHDM